MTSSGFSLAPFRGLRFVADRVGDLGSVVSPPYDMLDADLVHDLEAASSHNVVRLILARGSERPYVAVGRRLEGWRAEGYLRADPEPALYLYQYTVNGRSVRGLVGLVGLPEEPDGAGDAVLPHEEVSPAPVEDRVALMRTTRTNLEPILLVHRGTTALHRLLASVATQEPAEEFTAPDHSTHLLWLVTDPAALEVIARELAATKALIADGHHRYAAYRRLRRDATQPGWGSGLAMLVDEVDHPLGIGPIHRSVAGLTLADLAEAAEERGDELVWTPDREAAITAEPASGDQPEQVALAVCDGRRWAVYRTARTHELDAVVLHRDLLPSWHASEDQVGYHHALDQALAATRRSPGVVIAMRPPTVDQVRARALAGVRMPRKSTSFFPKPRMGVVMRDLRDG